jgi:hypothetical protein
VNQEAKKQKKYYTLDIRKEKNIINKNQTIEDSKAY